MPLLPWIQMGVQGLTSGFNTLMQNRLQKKQFAHDRAMAEYAYSQDQDMWNRQSTWNYDMWKLQNEYNLPANQMQRLREAGLNPNLVTGNAAAGGQAAAIQKAEMPKYSAARADYNFLPLEVPNMLGLYQNFKLANAQVDNVKAQERLAKEKALTESALRVSKSQKSGYEANIKYHQSLYANYFMELEHEKRERALALMALDEQIKKEMKGRTAAERGLKERELQWMSGFEGARPQDWIRMLEQFFKYFATKGR